MRKCSRCEIEQDLSAFYIIKNKHDYYCKACRKATVMASHRNTNKKKRCKAEGCEDASYAKSMCRTHYIRHSFGRDLEDATELSISAYDINPSKLMSYYGISLTQYKAMSKTGCNICGSFGAQGILQIDHDHACCNGKTACGQCIRGMLCASCNQTVSRYERGDINPLNKKIPGIKKYLKKYQTRKLKLG